MPTVTRSAKRRCTDLAPEPQISTGQLCLLDTINNDLIESIGDAVVLARESEQYAQYRIARNSAAFVRVCGHIGLHTLFEILGAVTSHRRSSSVFDRGDSIYQSTEMFQFFAMYGDWYGRGGQRRSANAPAWCKLFETLYTVVRYVALSEFGDWSPREQWLGALVELLMVRKNLCLCSGYKQCPARANPVIEAEIVSLGLTDSILATDPEAPLVQNRNEYLYPRDHPVHHLAGQRRPLTPAQSLHMFATNLVIDRHQAILKSLVLTLAWRTKCLTVQMRRNPAFRDGLTVSHHTYHRTEDPIVGLFRLDDQERVIIPDINIYPDTLMDIGQFIVGSDTPTGPWMRAWQNVHLQRNPLRFTIDEPFVHVHV